MAAFRIHEDENIKEKENRAIFKSNPNNIKGKEKRPTVFALLDNKQSNLRDGNGKQIINRDQKIKQSAKINDENVYPKHVVAKENDVKGPVTNFKAFSIYQNENESENNKKLEDKEIEISVEEKCANISATTLRDPLRELKPHDLLETPMSVSEMVSPMSVDKSMLEGNNVLLSPCPRNDRERFFEIEEYQLDILDYLKEAETRNRPKYGYMKKQPDITYSMRTILVDWLVEVCEEYRLQSETLCLAISYIDRFLSYMSVVRAKLQLVGTAAMYIAAKYEEIYPPDISEFVFITDDTYTKKQVLRMEQLILKVLSFDLSLPTTQVFIQLYAILNDVPEKVKTLALYFCELSLLQADPYLQYVPSRISAAALALARYMSGQQMWTTKLEATIGYTLDDLQEIILQLNRSHKTSGNIEQQAIQDKYKANKNLNVSLISPCHLDEDVFYHLDANTSLNGPSSENNEDVRQMISSLIFT